MDPVAGTSATYDLIAGAYDERNRKAAAPELQAFRERFVDESDGPLADLGCGPGPDLVALQATGRCVVGVDLSAGMLAHASARGLPVVRGDLRQPPLRPGCLGGIWSCAALLHVPREHVPATLAAWRSLLRPNGVLALSTALGDGERWEQVDYVDGGLSRWFVYHQRQALLDLVAAAGFTVRSCEQRTSHREWALVLATA